MTTKRQERTASGAAIAAGGGVAAGTGLAAGGVPGGKSDFTTVLNLKEPKGKTKPGRLASAAIRNRHVARAAPGGILGFRTHAHQGGMVGFEQQAAHKAGVKPPSGKEAGHAFSHGYVQGKIAPEAKIIRHMKGGKKAAAGLLVGGAATTAYGLKRTKVEKAQRHNDQYSGTLAGAGGAGLAVSAGGHKLFRGQERKWRNTANTSVDEAQKLVPGLGGRQGQRLSLKQMHKYRQKHGPDKPWPKSMTPERSMSEISRDKKVFQGVHPEVARKAGQLRGVAAQAEHFSHVYGSTAKVVGRLRGPSAIVAGAGVGGLAASRKPDKRVSKSDKPLMSDAQLRRRRKAQSSIGRTTSTMGLTGLGVTGVAAVAAKKPGVLRAVRKAPGLKDVTPKKMEGYALKTGIVSGGIGGIGGFNQAAIYGDEARRKKQTTLKKGLTEGTDMGVIEMGFFGEEGRPVKLKEIEAEVEKAWTPAARNFDSEASRQKRAKVYEGGSLVAAGGAGAYTAHHGLKTIEAGRGAKPKVMAPVEHRRNAKGNPYKIALATKGEHAIPVKGLKAVGRHGGRTALGAGAVAAAAGTHAALKRKQSGSWQPYAKRDTFSAFGVDHGLDSSESTV